MLSTAAPTKTSTPNSPSLEKSSSGVSSRAGTFESFIQNDTGRIMRTPRGDLIALYRTLISAKAFPTITCWADLYRFMCRRSASPDALDEARKLWASYKSKYQPAESPGTSRRIHDG